MRHPLRSLEASGPADREGRPDRSTLEERPVSAGAAKGFAESTGDGPGRDGTGRAETG